MTATTEDVQNVTSITVQDYPKGFKDEFRIAPQDSDQITKMSILKKQNNDAMIVDFQLLNEDMLTIGKARLNLPTEDVEATRLGLRATAESIPQCRWLEYDIYWIDTGAQECHERIHIQPCPVDY